jgi:hypothetical protein
MANVMRYAGATETEKKRETERKARPTDYE